MILVHKTFTEVTPESAEDGDFSDTGMIWDNAEFTFRDLVYELRAYPNASCWPATGETYEWYSSGFDVRDYRTGTEREVAIHFSRDNKPHAARYWRLAAIVAGIVERKN